jgi:GntR family transcriptional repressor for pyruvate dehydrogenase complex
MFGIARNTLRKALSCLRRDGTISRHIGRGTFVARETTNISVSAAESLMRSIHGSSPTDIMELRLILEPPFVALAASRANSRDLLQIAHCLERSEAAKTALEFEHWDGKLHHAILASTHNGLLTDVYDAISGVRKQPEWEALKQRSLTSERHRLYKDQHRRIVKALSARDAQAASKEVRAHLLEVKSGLAL